MAFEDPGRTRHDDSLAASSPQGPRHHGHEYDAGYETDAATRIGDEETDMDYETQRLRELHEGRHRSDGDHSTREADRDKKRIAQALCSHLPLAHHEKAKVVSTAKYIDYSTFGFQKAIPRVVLGLVAVIVDEQLRDDVNDFEELVQRSDEFRDARNGLDISMSDLATIKERVRKELVSGSIRVRTGIDRPKRDPALPDPPSPEHRPDEYWGRKTAEELALIAKHWDRRPDAAKETIPDDYHDLIDRLRRWAPWELESTNEEAFGLDETEASLDVLENE